ncbi:MAG: MerR family transcriptional regulator [Clostridia bacterium]|nr:MerR family transcriptional regulator [Clostridia bacterium]MBR6891186.1 MerR family transcriptional regulator [Clostridia bacterium]
MMTIGEVSATTGVSVRALRLYDGLGLLRPAAVSDSGYRLYDDEALERLSAILLFKELEFPLKDIRGILDSPAFDRNRALDQQIELLRMKIEHLENLIDLAKGIKAIGVKHMNFTAFDTKKIDEYARQAKASYGQSPEYREYEQKSAGRTKAQELSLGAGLMDILAAFGGMRDADPAGEAARAQVEKLQAYITEHFYTCSDSILLGLGHMYAGGGAMTENIDAAGGPGTAEFAWRAIEAKCAKGD